MKITNKNIEDSKQNRDKFNKYYNDAVIDVIALKEDCNMTIEQIQQTTPYDIDFILHVFENYMINKRNGNDDNVKEYDLSVKANKYHKNIGQITEKYGEKMMEEILKEEELKETYYFSK
jgi:hypothetical protein